MSCSCRFWNNENLFIIFFQQVVDLTEENLRLVQELAAMQKQLQEQKEKYASLQSTQEGQLEDMRKAGHSALAMVVEEYKASWTNSFADFVKINNNQPDKQCMAFCEVLRSQTMRIDKKKLELHQVFLSFFAYFMLVKVVLINLYYNEPVLDCYQFVLSWEKDSQLVYHFLGNGERERKERERGGARGVERERWLQTEL